MPEEIVRFGMAEADGNLFVVGGYLNDSLDSIYKLTCSGTCEWELMEQKLERGRTHPVVLPLMNLESLVSCNLDIEQGKTKMLQFLTASNAERS